MKTNHIKITKTIICAGFFLLGAESVLKAAAGKDTWVGSAGTANWADGANWVGANTPPTTGDTPTFGTVGAGGATLNNNLASLTSFLGLTFNSGAPSFTLNGNAIDSTGGLVDNSLNLETINLNVQFTATHSVNAITGGTMLIGGVISGAGGVTKTGGGTVTLTNANLYTGTTAVNVGTLKLDFNAAGAPSANIVKNTSVLSLGGGTLLVNGSSSSASAQAFGSLTVAAGKSTISAAPASGANNPTVTLGAITASAGGSVVFTGPATVNSGGNVAATAIITTTTAGPAGAGQFGVLGSDNSANTIGHYATVGLYDWASTFLAGGTAGSSPYTIIGGSQVTGFYTTTPTAATSGGGNFDMQANATLVTAGAQRACSTVRFNTPAATTFDIANNLFTCGGMLITPNMAANNATITTSAGGTWQVVRTTSNGSQQGVIWQNNILGFFNFNAAIIDGRQGLTTPTSILQAGPGTVAYLGANTYSGQTYLNGGVSEITADNGFGAVATGAQVNMNGGTILGNANFSLDNAGANKRNVVLGNNGGGLAATTGNTMIISGVVSGAGALTIGIPASSANNNLNSLVPGTGAGTANPAVVADGGVSLSGVNTVSGNTTITSGTLALAATGSINSTPQILVAPNAVFDVSAVSGYTLGGAQILAGSGTNNGAVNTASGSSIYAGTDGGYGTNTFNNNLTFASGAGAYLDLGTLANGSNDLISVGGTLTLNSTTFHVKAPSTLVNLDTTSDYVLITAASISGTPNSTVVWDTAPANFANFIVNVSGNSVVLHYSASAPPSGTGSANPSTANRTQKVLFTISATAGSSPVASVVLDASLIGGSGSVSLVRSNLSSLYTNTVTVSAGTAPAIYSLPATITDTASPTPLSSVVNIALTVVNSQTWNGLGANDNWSSSLNWLSGLSPVSGDSVTFAGTARPTPLMDGSYNLTGVTFNNTAGSFTLGTSGSTLTLSSNGIVNNSASTEIVNTPLVFSAAQTINAAAGNLVLSQPVDNGGNLLSFDGSRSNLVSGMVSGAGGLTKNGSGLLTLTASNSYSGATTVAAGILEVTNAGSINGGAANVSAVGGAQLLVDGGTLSVTTGNVGVPSSGLLVSSGQLNYSGALSMDLGNNNNAVINVSGGALTAASLALGRTALNNTTQPGSGSTSQGLYINGGSVNITNTLNMGTTSAGNSSANVRIDSGSLTVGGALTIGLNNGGRWSDLDVNGGTVTVNDTVTGISIGGPLAGNAVLLLRNGTVNAGIIGLGFGAIADTVVLSQTGGSLYVGSGGIVKVSPAATATVTLSAGTLGANADWSSSMPMTLGTTTIKAGDAANVPHNIALGGILSGGSLTKTGNGTLTLSAVNTYSGLTAINAGTLALAIDGVTFANGSVSGSISVATNAVFDVSGLNSVGGFLLGNAKTISGLGTVTGAFAAVDGSTISPAGLGAQGKINFATGLAVTNMTFKLELTSDPTGVSQANDSVNITGDLSADGLNNIVVTPVGSLGLGTYKLIKYTGVFNGDLSKFSCVAGVLTNPPGEINLIVTSVRPVATLAWRGDGVSDLWDTGISSNWFNGVGLDRFYTGDTNVFDDTAVSFTVNLSGSLTPASGSVVLVNATHDYTFNNGGSISGGTGLTKTNTGNLTIQGDNDYSGITTINGGTLSAASLANGGAVSSIGSAGAAAANLVLNGGALEYLGATKTIDRSATLGANGGTLGVTSGTTLNLSGTLTGPGQLTKTDNGQLTLSGANNYQGGTLITAGTLRGNPATTIGTNMLTLNGTTSATYQFSGDGQSLGNVLNVIGANNFLATAGNDTLNKVIGNGTVNLNGSGAQTLTLQLIDSSSFTGTFFVNTLPNFRFFPTSGTTLNASNATFNLGTGSGVLFNRDGGNYSLGALAGSGAGTFLRGSGNSGSALTTYTIGGNNADSDYSGTIANGTGGGKTAIVKVGTGRLTLSGANTYNSSTTISGGVLALGNGGTDGSINSSTPVTIASNAVLDVSLRSDATLTIGGTVTQVLLGNGLILGQLNVATAGTVTPGDATSAIGKLTATNAITLGGIASLKLNRTNSPNCDVLVSSNTLTFGGTLTVANVGPALQSGDTFTLFNATGGFIGDFVQTNLPALGSGLNWNWNPATGQLSVSGSGINTTPTNIVASVSGSTLTLTWPADHIGWRLQVQTNSIATGLNNNWVDVAGANTTNSVNAVINPANGAVFYRLITP